MAHLAVSDVRAKYGALEVLKGINFSIEKGEIAALVGPSGSGKSTVLRALMGLTPITGGHVELAGERMNYSSAKEVRAARDRMAIVFQQYNLFQNMTVMQNLTLAPLKIKKWKKAEVEAEARRLLGVVGLSDKADSYSDQLSGGQQQRVALARALALKPQILLLDEVTSALDPELVNEVLDAIRKLADEGMTMIIVSHEMAFVREVADKVVFMDTGQIIESWHTAPNCSTLRKPTGPATSSRRSCATELAHIRTTQMLKFYYNAAPNPLKVGLFLEEIGIPEYSAVPIDTRRGQQHSPEYRAINPNGKVPAIDDDGTIVFDSNAILLYLAEKTGQFLPPEDHAGRAAVVADVRGQRGRAVFRAGRAFPQLRAREDPLRHQALRLRGAAALADRRGPAGSGALHAGRHLYHRRHGRVGMGGAHSVHAGGRGAMADVSQHRAAGGRIDARPAAARVEALKTAHLKVGDRRRGDPAHLSADLRAGPRLSHGRVERPTASSPARPRASGGRRSPLAAEG